MKIIALALSAGLCVGIGGCAFLASQGATAAEDRSVTVENTTGQPICKVLTKSDHAKSEGRSNAVDPPLAPAETREIKIWLTVNVPSNLAFLGCDGGVVAELTQPYVKGELSMVAGPAS